MNVISSYLCFCWCDRNQTLVWCPVGHPFEASNCCFAVNTCKNYTNLSGQALLERSMITRWSLGDHCKEIYLTLLVWGSNSVQLLSISLWYLHWTCFASLCSSIWSLRISSSPFSFLSMSLSFLLTSSETLCTAVRSPQICMSFKAGFMSSFTWSLSASDSKSSTLMNTCFKHNDQQS